MMSEGEGGAVAETPAVESVETAANEGTPSAWYGSSLDEQTVGMLESRGWNGDDGAQKVIEWGQGLEKQFKQMQGNPEQFVKMPSDWENDAEVQEFRSKLGVPQSTDEYGVEFQDGDEHSPELLSEMHKLGLNKDQFNGLYNYLQSKADAMNAQSDEMFMKTSEEEYKQFQRESGKAFEQKDGFIKAAVDKLGWDTDKIAKVEEALGTYEFMNSFSQLGATFSESSSVGLESQSGSGFVMTPAEASYQINELKADDKWRSDYLDSSSPGHAAANAKLQKLLKLKAGE